MLIKSLLIRQGGTHVELPGEKLHFKPNELGDHVADVKLQSNIDVLLKITHGYCAYEEVKPAPTKSLEEIEAERKAAEAEVLARAAAAQAAADAAKQKDADEQAARVQAEKDRLAAEEQAKAEEFARAEAERKAAEKAAAEQDRANVAAEYLEIAGKAPKGNWGANKIREELAILKAK